LTSQFDPLFKRLVFLFNRENSQFDINEIVSSSSELVAFVQQLNMGKFYANRIRELLEYTGYPMLIGPYDPQAVARDERARREHFDQICTCSESIIALAVELLRYQDWPFHRPSAAQQ
jgi:hypothetical protein